MSAHVHTPPSHSHALRADTHTPHTKNRQNNTKKYLSTHAETKAWKWEIMTSIGSQRSLCATHTAALCTQKLIYTQIPLCMLCILDWNSSSSLFGSVWLRAKMTVEDEEINRMSPDLLLWLRETVCYSSDTCTMRTKELNWPWVIAVNLRVLESNFIII